MFLGAVNSKALLGKKDRHVQDEDMDGAWNELTCIMDV